MCTVLQVGESDPDIFFTDRPRDVFPGQRNREVRPAGLLAGEQLSPSSYAFIDGCVKPNTPHNLRPHSPIPTQPSHVHPASPPPHHHTTQCLSFFADEEAGLLRGRSPMQCYVEFMR